MSLMDDLIVNAAAAVEAMSKVATNAVDRSKVVVSSTELKNKISSQFETLGRYIYDTHESGNTDPVIVDQYVNDITELINELKSLQDVLKNTSKKIVCPKCSCANSNDSLFCKKCGASLDFSNDYTVGKKPVTTEKPLEEVKPAEEAAEPEQPEEVSDEFFDI